MEVGMRRLVALLLGLLLAGLAVGVMEWRVRRGEGGGWGVVLDPPGIKYGLRDPQLGLERGWVEPGQAPARDPGRARVLCVGDSVTYGVQVKANQAWPGVLESIVGPQRVEVFNFGLNGYDAEQASNLVRYRLAAWQPDLIIWGNYQNDVFPTYLLRGTVSDKAIFVGTDIPDNCRLLPEAPSLWLVRHSAIFRGLQAAAYERAAAEHGRFTLREDWYNSQVSALADWVGEAGIPVLVLAIPAHVLASMEACPEQVPAPGQCDRLLSQYGRITSALEQFGLPWVDGLAVYQASGQPHFIPRAKGANGATFKDVDHPNPDGHKVLANALLPRVLDLLHLPPMSAPADTPQ